MAAARGRIALGVGLVAAVIVAAIWVVNRREQASAALAAAQEIERLRAEQGALHDRLTAALARNPFAPDALGDQDVAVAIRPAFVASMVEEVAHQYLNAVDLDLGALETKAGGVLRGKVLFGEIDLGEWRLGVVVENLRGRLRAGHPRLRFGTNRVEVAIPVTIEPAPAKVTLDFAWHSAGLVNVVCHDFELVREVDGRVIEQQHMVAGSVDIAERGRFLSATPLIPDPTVPLRVDLTDESWAVVDKALRSQDSLGRCGMLLKPDQVLARLHALANRGIDVRLPKVLFQSVRLPTQFESDVEMGGRTLALSVRGEQLRIDPELIWTTASLDVATPSASP